MKQETSSTRLNSSDSVATRKSHGGYWSLRILRALAGLLAIAQIPAVFGLGSTQYTRAESGGQLIGLFFFGILFVVLGRIVNALHQRRHGEPHPSLRSFFGL